MTLRLGWFTSGEDEGARETLRTILHGMQGGTLDVTISFVFCNWEEGEEPSGRAYEQRQALFAMIRPYGIPLVTLSWLKVKESWSHDPSKDWRVCYGKRMRTLLYERPFELGVLSGYSMPLDEDSCTRFDLIGLNPSLPGDPHAAREEAALRAIRNRARKHGATMHICGAGEETGPAVTFCSFPLDTPDFLPLWKEFDALVAGRGAKALAQGKIDSSPLFRRLVREEARREIPLVTYTIKLFADGDLDIVNGRLLAEGMIMTSAFDLSGTVDRSLQQVQF